MKIFAVLSGVFLGAILLVGAYAMAYLARPDGYEAPLVLAIGALAALPVLYWAKAARKLSRPLARIAFTAMVCGIAAAWLPLVASEERAKFAPQLIVFTVVWLVASLPVLRAGIRHRP